MNVFTFSMNVLILDQAAKCRFVVFVCTPVFTTKGCVKMFPSKTRADVGMVQCVSEGHGKPPGGKTTGTRRRAGPCKEGDQPVPAKPMQIINTH